ncbi:LacI family DNA-binding transcriptional regulator [Bacillus swezeyi]|uniref:LacI family transcriptional regulator n=1 Tax=Bacillus swezeyi TaxID=1925020 RepID=A0A1R1S101_9BACI|nr:LacI family DNA-binding transcriptional regulator [Bacillus swezeyi]MEC1259362.1 LacI family DNA-binding transcriptional regulator [Bacillus swezeyi]MED1740686.1 LacI family DNA-binding transcriptional regulator [Bacillus swezeyi]MED2927676.1 LacI family DNA-binding transcriptional regulator [Bacillus swezeyi]MED2965411.1 LacI family DNA-binding transcriptional regulator [Bacillus swezeyi]MED3071672.1 LacI family DNA-binding transcriptional regulator [Bacillus swezeyi]
MATIKDVALAAKVSVATVSRVLNETGYVHEDTKTRVMKAMEELNYRPNEVARSLYKRESRLIGLLLPDITNPFFPQLARGVEDEIHRNGFRLIFGNSDENLEKELDYLQTFKQNHVVGVISATNYPDASNYKDLSMPIVFLDRTGENAPSVFADSKQGGRIAASEIIRRNASRITLIKGPGHLQTAKDRFNGALEVLSGADVDFHVMKTETFSFQEAQKRAAELFSIYPETDGIIASNDIVATAVLHEALKRKIKVPDDLQIIGFDDIPQSELLFPPLSTIRQPAYQMGIEAAKLLLRLMKHEYIEQSAVQMPVAFIERQTTRKADDNE